MTFSHGEDAIKIENPCPLESTYSSGESTDVPLGQFLARPVKIFETSPAMTTTAHVQFYPWELFLDDPLVKRRIEGFRHVRGKLHIRAVCTGNPFMYGKYGLSYRPFFDRSVHQLCGVFSDARIIQATSCPHIFIDPTTSEGGEMVLPFFSPFNWIDLSETKMRRDMGMLDFFTVVPLRHANSATSTFNVQFYAWMEDAEICTPTSSAYDTWTLQSAAEFSAVATVTTNFFSSLFAFLATLFLGKSTLRKVCKESVHEAFIEKESIRTGDPLFEEEEKQNEFAQHPVSTTASAVAKAAGALSHVPGISSYAKATEMGAKATATIAKAFGFSRPANLDNIARYKPYVGEFATTNTHEPITRLGLDVKGELTVDPRTVGLDGTDELSIKYLLGKEVVFQKFDWAEGTASGTPLGELNVTPMNGDTDTTTMPPRFVMTPQAAVASLFRFWSGTVIYRFQVVASALHRGKIRIVYDPIETNTNASNEVYSRVIDISETRDFEVPVNWHSMTPYLEVENLAIPASGQWNSATTLATFSPKYNNGQLRLEVFTPLQSPDPSAGNDITIVVSTRCGEDFKFMRPSSFESKGWTFTSSDPTEEPQSNFEDGVETQDNEPVEGTPLETIGAGEAPITDHLPMVFGGETIESLRALLRRYSFLGQPSTASAFRTRPDISSSSEPLRPLEFIMNSYVGWRGTLRYKTLRLGVERWMVSVSDGLEGADWAGDKHANAGAAFFYDVPEFEIPFYSNLRFGMAQANQYWVSGSIKSYGTQDPNNIRIQTYSLNPANGTAKQYIAAGEDFSLFFFTGVPPIYATV